jgi:uncharacterized repeat protein (TIGR02543 family)
MNFVSNQGTAVNAITAQPGTAVSAPTNPTRNGYSFAGWFSDEALTTSYTFTTMPSEAITLYAKWTINQYTITFDSNEGTSVTAITQDFDTAVSAPTNPTRTGYTFAGWFSDEALTTAYSFTTMPSQSITLYAKWTISQYSINFNSTGGSAVDRITQDFGTSVSAPTNPTWTGYTFTGWLTFPSLTPYTFTTMPSQNITLYADWTINQYTITFVSNLGTSVTAITQDFDTAVSAPTNPTRTGYTFAGWFSDEALTTAYSFTTMPSQATTLYAKWNPNSYSISYSYKTTETEEFRSVISGGKHSLAISTTGNLYAWGDNTHGQLGDGTDTIKDAPTLISFTGLLEGMGLLEGETIQQVSAGYEYSLALTTSGRLYSWGNNGSGQLGYPFTSWRRPKLINFTGLDTGETIAHVAAGFRTSFAVTTSGNLYGWGSNGMGYVGDGTNVDRNIPTLIGFTGLTSGEKIKNISVGESHALALTTSGRVYAWGRNHYGQLGDNTLVDKSTPTLITFSGLDGLTIQQVSGGATHSLALDSAGRVYAWGDNSFNQLGDGTSNSRLIPTLISFSGLTIRKVLATTYHSLAITALGQVYGWGNNGFNQLGNNNRMSRNIPGLIQFTGLNDGETVVDVSYATNGNFSNAVTTDNRLYAWSVTIVAPSPLSVSLTSTTLVTNYLTVNYNDAITLVDPSLEGYDFAGWFMDEALTIPYNLTTMPANDVTLYASFNPEA